MRKIHPSIFLKGRELDHTKLIDVFCLSCMHGTSCFLCMCMYLWSLYIEAEEGSQVSCSVTSTLFKAGSLSERGARLAASTLVILLYTFLSCRALVLQHITLPGCYIWVLGIWIKVLMLAKRILLPMDLSPKPLIGLSSGHLPILIASKTWPWLWKISTRHVVSPCGEQIACIHPKRSFLRLVIDFQLETPHQC